MRSTEAEWQWQWQQDQTRWALIAPDGRMLAETIARRMVRQSGPPQITGDWETWAGDHPLGVFSTLRGGKTAAETHLQQRRCK